MTPGIDYCDNCGGAFIETDAAGVRRFDHTEACPRLVKRLHPSETVEYITPQDYVAPGASASEDYSDLASSIADVVSALVSDSSPSIDLGGGGFDGSGGGASF